METYPQILDQYTVMGIQLRLQEHPYDLELYQRLSIQNTQKNDMAWTGGTFNTSQI